MDANDLRFLTDRMLGKLAKYLLMLGFDTVYFSQDNRLCLITLAVKQGRVVLTRDTNIVRSSDFPELLFINDNSPIKQIQQVIKHFELKINENNFFTRCLRCNQLLIKITPQEVKHKVPPYVLTIHQEFFVCQKCKRVYWKGTHQKRMSDMIKRLILSLK